MAINTTNIPNQNIPVRTDTSAGTTKLTNGQLWEIKVTLNNHSGKEMVLPTDAILHLMIEDTSIDWVFRGILVYKNIFEGLERASATGQSALYIYRMDARDEINISIRPITDAGNFPERIWTASFDFVVYDTEDPKSTNNIDKVKKLYFWSKNYQLLKDKYIQWSTSTAQSIQDAYLKPDANKTMKTGLIIKSLIEAAGLKDFIDNGNWDEGSNSIQFTAPVNASVSDCIDMVYEKHVSNTGEKCLLNTDRHLGKLRLVPFSNFFDKAGSKAGQPGDLQVEHFFIEDISGDGIITPFKAPISRDVSFEKDIKMIEWNRITNYQFVDMAGIDNAYALVNRPVYWYKPNKKQFGVNFKDNEINNIKSEFKKLYVDKLYAANGFPLFTLNKDKTEHYNVQADYIYVNNGAFANKKSRNLLGKAKTLFAGILLNECIRFQVLGSTHRLAGTFIGIDRMSDSDNEFDNKLCGQWFVVNVKHVIVHNKYVNDILAVKVHAHEKLDINENKI